MAAFNAASPTPMYVGTPRNMMGSLMGGDGGGFRDDRPVYTVPDGPCGFAWVSLYANDTETRRLCNYLRDRRGWSGPSRYYGTRFNFVQTGSQSYVRNDAYARAFAQTLRDQLGVTVYAGSRLD